MISLPRKHPLRRMSRNALFFFLSGGTALFIFSICILFGPDEAFFFGIEGEKPALARLFILTFFARERPPLPFPPTVSKGRTFLPRGRTSFSASPAALEVLFSLL